MSPAHPSDAPAGRAPARIRVRLTDGGRVLAAIAVAGCALGWLGGDAGRLFAAAALAPILLAAALGRWNLAGLRFLARTPARATVGDRLDLEVTLGRAARAGTSRDLVGQIRGGAASGEPAALPAVPAGAEVRATLPLRLRRRGPVERISTTIESGFPLDLLRWRAELELSVDLLALPRTHSVPALFDRGAADRDPGRVRRPLAVEEDELTGLREWRPGERLRGIHWRISARLGRTIRIERLPVAQPAARLVLVTRFAGAASAGTFERAVAWAASLGEEVLRRGRPLDVTVQGTAREASELSAREASELSVIGAFELPRLRGRVGRIRLLEALARVRAGAEPESQPRDAPPGGAGGCTVVVVPEPCAADRAALGVPADAILVRVGAQGVALEGPGGRASGSGRGARTGVRIGGSP